MYPLNNILYHLSQCQNIIVMFSSLYTWSITFFSLRICVTELYFLHFFLNWYDWLIMIVFNYRRWISNKRKNGCKQLLILWALFGSHRGQRPEARMAFNRFTIQISSPKNIHVLFKDLSALLEICTYVYLNLNNWITDKPKGFVWTIFRYPYCYTF